MSDQTKIEAFLAGGPYAVVGASCDRTKEGNRVLRSFVRSGMTVFPVNPGAAEVEGLTCYSDLASVPRVPHGICITTPPRVTESIVEQAGRLGVKHVWMQPGAESERAVDRAHQLGMNLIAGGPCIKAARGTARAPQRKPGQ